MAMRLAAVSIRAALGLERQFHRLHQQVHGAQQVGQHVVGLDGQVVGLKFHWNVAVAQVVGGAQQVERAAVVTAVGDAQHRLRAGHDDDEAAVFCHQHVAATQYVAARQQHADVAPEAVLGEEAAFLAHVPVQFQTGCALQQHACQPGALGNAFGGLQHGVVGSGSVKTGSSVAPAAARWRAHRSATGRRRARCRSARRFP